MTPLARLRKRHACAVLVVLAGALHIATPARVVGGADESASTADDIAHLRATQEVFHEVAARLRPYLVRIDTVGGSQPPAMILPTIEDEQPGAPPRAPRPFRDSPGSDFALADGSTTGIIYSADGYIITSSFNFVRDPVLISVTLSDGRQLAADLIARDRVRKIALLQVDAKGLPVPTWVRGSDIRVGQWTIALGLGLGSDHPSVTVGIISALSRMHGNAIQTDAKLSPANYGGPLCDIHGRIIGMSAPMAQRPGELAGVEMYDSGIGFVVGKRRVDEIVEELKTGRSFYRGWLGISADPHSFDGVVIARIADPSPMHEAGVKPGDKLIAAQGKPIKHFAHLIQALYMLPAGERVSLKLERDGEPYDIDVTLARSVDLGTLSD